MTEETKKPQSGASFIRQHRAKHPYAVSNRVLDEDAEEDLGRRLDDEVGLYATVEERLSRLMDWEKVHPSRFKKTYRGDLKDLNPAQLLEVAEGFEPQTSLNPRGYVAPPVVHPSMKKRGDE